MSSSRKRKPDSQLALSTFFGKQKQVDGGSRASETVSEETVVVAAESDESGGEDIADSSIPAASVAAADEQVRGRIIRRDLGQDYDMETKKWSSLPSSLSKESKFEMISNHFEPDANYTFVPHKDNEGRQRTFRLQWLHDNAWLRYSPKCNGGFCLPCVLFPAGADQGQLTASPLTNYKKATTLLKKTP